MRECWTHRLQCARLWAGQSQAHTAALRPHLTNRPVTHHPGCRGTWSGGSTHPRTWGRTASQWTGAGCLRQGRGVDGGAKLVRLVCGEVTAATHSSQVGSGLLTARLSLQLAKTGSISSKKRQPHAPDNPTGRQACPLQYTRGQRPKSQFLNLSHMADRPGGSEWKGSRQSSGGWDGLQLAPGCCRVPGQHEHSQAGLSVTTAWQPSAPRQHAHPCW